MRKSRSPVEVINDRYDRLVNLLTVMRDPELAEALQIALSQTPYAIREYEAARHSDPDPVEDARRLLVLSAQSHSSVGASGGETARSGWRRGVRDRGVNTAMEWRDMWQQVERWQKRLMGVYIESQDATAVIQTWDSTDTLFYVDPPYLAQTRASGRNAYKHEMTETDHILLAKTLLSVKGSVVISGYANKLYDDLYGDWVRVEKQTAGDAQSQRTEVLWLSPSTQDSYRQASLFEAGGKS